MCGLFEWVGSRSYQAEKRLNYFFTSIEEGEGNPRAAEKCRHNLWLFFCSPLILFSADGGSFFSCSKSLPAGDLCGDVFWEITADNGQSRALVVTSSDGQDCQAVEAPCRVGKSASLW